MIRIRNIYHMMAYAFEGLDCDVFRRCGAEDFENMADLMAEILIIGVSQQLRRGLRRGYIPITEETSSPRGRIEVNASMSRGRTMGHLVCTYDEFSADILENRIIVTTLRRLLLSGIEVDRSERIRIILRTLQDVRTLDPKTIRWDTINTRGTTAYTTLMSVCRLVLDGMLPTEESGQHKMSMFLSDQALSRLYEKFLLGYFRREHPELKVSSPMIEWDLESGYDEFLPVMKSDIVLRQNGCTMIIDAKYYGNNMQENHGKRTIHSGNLYQIFTYVKNMASCGDEVSGMLLYAATDSPVQPNSDYVIGGSRIMVRTLDLDCEFRRIADHLDDIAAMMGNTDSTFSDPIIRVMQ